MTNVGEVLAIFDLPCLLGVPSLADLSGLSTQLDSFHVCYCDLLTYEFRYSLAGLMQR